MRRLWDVMEVGVLGILGAASLVIAVLGSLDVLPGPPGLVPTLTLFVVGLVAGHLAIERRRTLDRIEMLVSPLPDITTSALASGHKLDRIETLVSSFNDQFAEWIRSRVTTFPTLEDFYAYINQRLDHAERTIDMLSWGDNDFLYEQTESEKAAFAEYRTHKQAASRQHSLRFREINSYHRHYGTRYSEEMLDGNPHGYGLRYYDFGGQKPPPLMEFVIFDRDVESKAEAIIGFYRGRDGAQENEMMLATRHPPTVMLFASYFEVLWHGAVRIKEPGKVANMVVIEAIKERLNNPNSGRDDTEPQKDK